MDKTFLKGLTLLEALARAEKACGVTELANILQLTKSNVHRLLQGLVHQGFARKVGDTGRYELTIKLWELGSSVFARLDVRHVSQPFMETLSRETSETVHLAVLDGIDVLYIAKIEGPQPLRSYTAVGGRAPAQCVAVGKAQLPWSSAETIQRVKQALHAHSSKSIITAEELDRELMRARVAGYAVNTGEWRELVCGVAAPIRDRSGEVIAAVAVSGPVERLSPGRMQALGPSVAAVANQISALLGYVPPRCLPGSAQPA
jgi:IclR family KDG regulon transcriptional repressor